jgi:hypothetical protein
MQHAVSLDLKVAGTAFGAPCDQICCRLAALQQHHSRLQWLHTFQPATDITKDITKISGE